MTIKKSKEIKKHTMLRIYPSTKKAWQARAKKHGRNLTQYIEAKVNADNDEQIFNNQ